ncbi:MAG: hypothetical protein Q8O99_03440 [bacterium]|nr:hypothetical protein [bacterium]
MIQETNHPDRSKFYQLVLKYTQAPQQSSVPEIQALGKFTEEALGDSEAVFRRKISSNY